MFSDIIYRGRALRIAVGIMVLVLVMVGGAGATKFIRNDATGGDCISFGTWNSITKTCTLTTDLTDSVFIDSNGITLDGNRHKITATFSKSGSGVSLSGINDVTLKNLNIEQFHTGISLYNTSNNTLSGNNVSNNYFGIALDSSRDNILNGNNASNNEWTGIFLEALSPIDSNNTLNYNIANSNGEDGIRLYKISETMLNGNAANSNGYDGINLDFSFGNTLINNNVFKNAHSGIYVASAGNELIGNNASYNKRSGIVVNGYYAQENLIYWNDIINNIDQSYSAGINNTWDNGTIGNHYSYFDEPSEGCMDTNSNGICDASFNISGNSSIDRYPLVSWKTVSLPSDILSYYRRLGNNPNITETTDLLKAADDWSGNKTVPGFVSPITTQQLLTLADEWSRSSGTLPN